MHATAGSPLLASAHLRIARPGRDLTRTTKFWVTALASRCQNESSPKPAASTSWSCRAGRALPGTSSLPATPMARRRPRPPKKTCWSLYLGQPASDTLIARLLGAGGRVVPARNPHWDRRGATIADPTATGWCSPSGHRSKPAARPAAETQII